MKILQSLALPVCLFFSSFFTFTNTQAQLKAAFVPNKTTVSCPPQSVTFTDASQGNPTSWYWDFGDFSYSNAASPTHIYVSSGVFKVRLTVRNSLNEIDSAQSTITVAGPSVQYSRTMDTSCSLINVKFTPKGTETGGGSPLRYTWDFGDGKTTSSINPAVTHFYAGASSYLVKLLVKDVNNCSIELRDTLVFGALNTVVPSTPNVLTATRECLDGFGWTNYYFDNNTADLKDDILLLSLKKNGNNIGTIGDGKFQVKVTATENAGSSSGIHLNSPVITNPSGYYVMNRYWVVEPSTQPNSAVGVRFYFNNQDLADINGSFPSHDADFSQLIFYKTKDGNPDPTTNLAGTTDIISIFPGDQADENHWTYAYNGSGSHLAEFLVSSFSGGGAGVTVNGEALPMKIVSFNGRAEGTAVNLKWSVAAEENVEKYNVLTSVDGRTFSTAGKVLSKGGSHLTTEYSFNDLKIGTESAKFYKLEIVDKDGKKSYSDVVKISLAPAASAVSLYPVPANSYVTISSKANINKTCTVDVYNALGLRVLQVHKNAPGNSFELNTSMLANGRYRVIVFNDSEKIGDAGFIVLH